MLTHLLLIAAEVVPRKPPQQQRKLSMNNIVIFQLAFKHINIYICLKATSLQALTGPEGSRRLRLPDFKTIGT
jgi:hypothetical protein